VGGVTAPLGFRAGGVRAGVKRSGRPDLATVISDRPACGAGVFTTNLVRAAPVVVGARLLQAAPTELLGIVAVAGVANAMTGPEGIEDTEAWLAASSRAFRLPAQTLLPACTGVIGPRLPLPKLIAALPALRDDLSRGADADARAAHAILTTDTRAKVAAVRARLADGTVVRVGGIAKGSGMISPRLALVHATTLAFVTTDARATPEGLSALLAAESDRTFNMVDVDGDTSTNDTVYLLANGAAGGRPAEEDPVFRTAVGDVLESLARQVARDGEGATKMLTVDVRGARDVEQARRAARAVVGSTLVKAALFGADPNVGRIACALGYSGARLDPERLEVRLAGRRNPVPLIVEGRPAPGLANGGTAKVRELLHRLSEVTLEVRLHAGDAEATAWGCDLSFSYVQINAVYRT
jgi:glutamate N-acetyltransferase / amino-acid N-acetyltransferase